MSKKNISQTKIKQFIYDDYIFNKEYESTDDILKNIQLLIDNNLASCISGKEDLSITVVSRYRIASKIMCKYNKSLKNYKRRALEHEFINERILCDESEDLCKLGKEGLDSGTYYANLGDKKHDDYAIFKVLSDNENEYEVSFSLYFVGKRHKKFKNKFFDEVEKYKEYDKQRKYEYTYSFSKGEYKDCQFKSFDKMVFTNKDKFIKYIDNWVNNIPTYYKYEMTPKLSILLYGEPGTGKSTFCKALAKYLGIECVGLIDANYFSVNENNKRRGYCSDMVYSIDDIDCICNSRENDDSGNNSKALASLLEFLDNPSPFYYKAKDGKYYPISIVIATTNYYDKLDDAVKRYGRFDLKIEMKPLDYNQAEELCALYNLSLSDVYSDEITENFSISPAYLQALCMENIDKSVKDNIKE